jgi:hypothetical protein
VWPAQSPTAAQYDPTANGTQYFLSTNAAEEANGTGTSSDLLTWSVTNTATLKGPGAPTLGVHVVSTPVNPYAVPLPAVQKAGPVPLADCLNVTACAKAVTGKPDRYKETERPLDSLDSRMQQVMYANGLLYGSNGTAVDVGVNSSSLAQQTGVAWYVTDPTTDPANGNLSTAVTQQGRLAAARNNLLMPSLGVRADGSAVIGVTLAGLDHYPSAAYVDLTGAGTGAIKVVAEGAGPEDGFAGYRIFGARPRWGDYGAAAIDPATGQLWVANEWIAQSCTFAQYQAAPFGQCGGTRTALANWSTRITLVG